MAIPNRAAALQDMDAAILIVGAIEARYNEAREAVLVATHQRDVADKDWIAARGILAAARVKYAQAVNGIDDGVTETPPVEAWPAWVQWMNPFYRHEGD